MKLSISILAGALAAGLMLCSNTAKAQPTIANVYPNGAYQFQSSRTISFNVSSTVGISNISVALTGTNLLTQKPSIAVYTTANGLTITGSSTSETVSAPLASNTLYGVIIQVTDTGANTSTTNLYFDTVAPAYTFEAEDYDYTSNSVTGSFFDNPQTNAYNGVTSTPGVDDNNPLNSNGTPNGTAGYRVNSVAYPALATEGNSDKPPRLAYIGTGKTDYDWGYTGSGQWGNYTRHYPAGVYNVFVRAANNNGASANAGDFSVVSGTATFSANGSSGPYYFSVPGTSGWQNFVWTPVVDSSNNLAEVTFDGSQSTLKVNCDNASFNADYYMLLPANTNPPVAGSVVITNMYPDGSQQFQQTNTLVFTASDTNDINPGNISVQLSGTSLLGSNTVALLTVGNGLTVSGPATNLTVAATNALNPDTTYSATVQVIDANGNVTFTNFIFDTVNPKYYTFEARDNDWGGGQFVDNPQTNAYIIPNELDGEYGVDFVDSAANPGYIQYGRLGLACDASANLGDVPRAPYINTGYADFDVGSVDVGDWGNYSRTYPAGIYNIYMRAASPSGESDSASMSEVTPTTPSTSSQTLSKLGTFAVPNTGGYQVYKWVQLKNSAGYPAQFNVGSTATVHTLRATTDNTGYNVHYYMLVPANLSIHTPPFVSSFTPDGTALFQYTNELSFVANSQAGISASGITVNVNGANVTGLITSGSPNLLNVSYPIAPNGIYNVVVTLTDSYGTSSSTNSFNTFSPDTYTWQAADYDYTSNALAGLFIDNPQTNAYAGLGATEGIDEKDDKNTGADYRPISGTGLGADGLNYGGLEFETPSGDLALPQYAGTSLPYYDIGFNDSGNWANYTRHYPAGTYNIWIRAASPNGNPVTVDSANVSLVTNGWGTASQGTRELGTFTIQNTGGWHAFGWAPLTDANGNYVQFTSDGSTNTLRVSVDNGGYNVGFYALVPANTSRPIVSNVFPNGTTLFQGTNKLAFSASSSAGLTTNDVILTLNGVTVSNLVFSGSSTNWNVSYAGLLQNTTYSATITVNGADGSYTESFSFDTYSPNNYQWEAEDWDYTSNGIPGLFFNNPQVDDYFGLASTEGKDAAQVDNGVVAANSFPYRPYDGINLVPGQQVADDITRPQFGTNTDYRITYFGYGSFCDYTRNYPAGTYNVVGRFTEGGANTVANLAETKSVDGNAAGLLGTFLIPQNGWDTWEYVTLTDNHGNPVTVTFDGGETTLQLEGNPVAAADPTINAGFFMLVPAVPPLKLTPSTTAGKFVISFPTQATYTYQILYKNSLSDASWTPLSSVTGNGLVESVTNLMTGNAGFYTVEQNP